MKVLNIIEEIAEMTPDNAQAQTRDEAIKNMGNWGKKLAMAALPTSLMMLAFQKKAQAGGNPPANSAIADVLNFALTLEYLESTFYNLAIAATNGTGATVTQTSATNTQSYYVARPGLIPSSDRAIFTQIAKHENAHVALLISAITSLGGTPITKPDFDFTASHSIAHPATAQFQPFSDYATFLQFSQAFEDAGVRAYKGQAGNLKYSTALTTALQIHSVEARHASEVRRLRSEKGWITQSQTTINAAFAGIYAGENNTTQGGLNVVFSGISSDEATQSFDEPLDRSTVETIAGTMIV